MNIKSLYSHWLYRIDQGQEVKIHRWQIQGDLSVVKDKPQRLPVLVIENKAYHGDYHSVSLIPKVFKIINNTPTLNFKSFENSTFSKLGFFMKISLRSQ